VDKGIIGHDCSAIGAKQLSATGPWSVPGDCALQHYEDTLKSGCYINDEKLARLLTHRIGRIIMDLQKLGMPFDRDENGKKLLVLGPAAGHSKPRSLRFSDITGKLIVDTLCDEARRRDVKFLAEHAAVDLMMGSEGIAGALVVDLACGEFVCIRSKAVLIATGGTGCLYELTSNPVQATGDGIALALKSGAELMDLEFVQFYPVTVLFPPAIRGMNLISHAYGAHLLNAGGERFMAGHDPDRMERITRDKLSRFIFREIQSGRTGPHGGVFMDATMIPADIYAKEIPSEWNLALSAGVDLSREKLEVAPSAHYYMGGIRIDDRCRTTLPGLFAAGECCAGVQGANRLADNGISEALVFGQIAGEAAAAHAASARFPAYDKALLDQKVLKITGTFAANSIPPNEILSRIRRLMTRQVGIIREEASLLSAADELEGLRRLRIRTPFGSRWHPDMLRGTSAANMALLAHGIALAALERKESRGAHFRSDYPHRNDAGWKANIVVRIDASGQFKIRIQNPQTEENTHWSGTK